MIKIINKRCHFLKIKNASDLCKLLFVSFKHLQNEINNPTYKTFEISKKNGGKRIIHQPLNNTLKIQNELLSIFQGYYTRIKPNHVHGFVSYSKKDGKKCNILENAKPHVGKKHLLNIDLKDFFPSIKAKRIKELFESDFFKFNENIATSLALLTTFEGRLTIGSPTSPVLSNFICYQMDIMLAEFCKKNKLTFTRYADDLSFSSDDYIKNDILLDIINIITENGFDVNYKKLRFANSNAKQTVTGITVNQKPNVDGAFLKKIRAILYDINKFGLEMATFKHNSISKKGNNTLDLLNILVGYILFVRQIRGVNDTYYQCFDNKLKEIKLKNLVKEK